MKIERKNLENSLVELIVEEDVKVLDKFKKIVFSEIEKTADIKWFRKWAHIPEEVILKEYWYDKIEDMIMQKTFEDIYRRALMQEKIMPIEQWEIAEVISENPLKIK